MDIETAGLGRDCSLLEFGAVIDDLNDPKPIEELPKFHTYILNDKIIGEPYALAMHQKILDRISKKETPYKYIQADVLECIFANFLRTNGYKPYKLSSKGEHIEIMVAGKNFAMFDRDWLTPLFKNELVKFNHRVIDPAILYYKLGDQALPNSKDCLKRANLDGEVAHTALEDAIMVIKLLRKFFHNK